MKIRAESLFRAAKAIIESGQEENFINVCRERGLFVTVNKNTVRHTKRALRRTDSDSSRGLTLARVSTTDDHDTCESND